MADSHPSDRLDIRTIEPEIVVELTPAQKPAYLQHASNFAIFMLGTDIIALDLQTKSRKTLANDATAYYVLLAGNSVHYSRLGSPNVHGITALPAQFVTHEENSLKPSLATLTNYGGNQALLCEVSSDGMKVLHTFDDRYVSMIQAGWLATYGFSFEDASKNQLTVFSVPELASKWSATLPSPIFAVSVMNDGNCLSLCSDGVYLSGPTTTAPTQLLKCTVRGLGLGTYRVLDSVATVPTGLVLLTSDGLLFVTPSNTKLVATQKELEGDLGPMSDIAITAGADDSVIACSSWDCIEVAL
jgi:hypothetical protein